MEGFKDGGDVGAVGFEIAGGGVEGEAEGEVVVVGEVAEGVAEGLVGEARGDVEAGGGVEAAAVGDVGEVVAAVLRPGEAVDVLEAVAAAVQPEGFAGDQLQECIGYGIVVMGVHQKAIVQCLT